MTTASPQSDRASRPTQQLVRLARDFVRVLLSTDFASPPLGPFQPDSTSAACNRNSPSNRSTPTRPDPLGRVRTQTWDPVVEPARARTATRVGARVAGGNGGSTGWGGTVVEFAGRIGRHRGVVGGSISGQARRDAVDERDRCCSSRSRRHRNDHNSDYAASNNFHHHPEHHAPPRRRRVLLPHRRRFSSPSRRRSSSSSANSIDDFVRLLIFETHVRGNRFPIPERIFFLIAYPGTDLEKTYDPKVVRPRIEDGRE